MDIEFFKCPKFAPSSEFYFLPNIVLPAVAAARQPLHGTIHAVHFLQIQTQYFFVTGDHGESPTPHSPPRDVCGSVECGSSPLPCTQRSLMEGTGSLTSSIWNGRGVGGGGG